ncbi:MAG: outer membrane protein assembly factor [Gemmatimonadaceae bacterium]
MLIGRAPGLLRFVGPALGCALLALGAVPARAPAQACEARTPELREVSFVGNHVFSDGVLQQAIASTPTSWVRRAFRLFGARRCLDPDEVPRDVARLLLHYRRRGYPRAEVASKVERQSAQRVALRFSIREGEPLRIATLSIVGAPPGATVDTGRRLPNAVDAVRAGRPMDILALDSAAQALRRRLQNRGYYSAAVKGEWRVDSASGRARVVLEATPGPPVRVGEVTVAVEPYPGRGQRVSDAALRRITGIESGRVLRARDLETARRNLASSDVYREATVRVDSVRVVDGQALAGVSVAASESYANDVELRAGWATLDCVRAQATLRRTAFLRATGQLIVTGRVSKVGIGSPLDFAPALCAGSARADPFSQYLNYYLGFTYTNPGLGSRPLRRSVSLFTERRSEYLAYVRTVYLGTALTASRPLGESRWVATLGYELSYGRTIAEPAVLCGVFSACLPADRQRLSEARRLGVLSALVARDGTDDASNPSRGTMLRAEVRGASRYLLSDPLETFIGVRLDGSLYRRLRRNVIGAARLRLASVWPGSSGQVPTEERLYAGGASTVRGFQQNELGPQVYLPEKFFTTVENGDTVFRSDPHATKASTIPSGGNALVVANAELRVRPPVLPTLLQVVGFVDAGALWNRGGAAGERDAKLRVTPGVGLRAFTPIGAARLDVGYNPYAPQPGPAYYDVALGFQSAPLYCVSPGNQLKVTGFGPVDAQGRPIPPVQADGPCPATFERERPRSFLGRLTLHFSFGQAF